MSTFRYATGDLRTGAHHAGSAAQHALSAHEVLGAPPIGGIFGAVGSASALHSAVVTAHRAHRLGSAGCASGLTASSQRLHATARLGDDATDQTARRAAAGAP